MRRITASRLQRAGTALVLGCLAVTSAISLGCNGRGSATRSSKGSDREPLTGPAIVELNLTHGASEAGSSSFLGPVGGHSFSDLVLAISSIDKETKGVFVRLGTGSMSLSQANEVGGLLEQVRKRGLPVVCHADEYQNGTLLLVSRGCSSIWVSPAGGVDSVGIAAQLLFGKSLFDKLGVTVDFLQVGKYKGAQEPYTRDAPSPEARESLEGTLHDLRTAWVDGINEGRGKDLSSEVEDGPYSPEDAKTAGLIDEVGYVDDAQAFAKEKSEAVRTVVRFGGRSGEGVGIGQVLRQIGGGDASARPHVAVLRASGAITMGSTGGLLGSSEGITEQSLGRKLTELTRDDSVKAVVLRIDSPGGSALASDLLWQKLMILREKKPLIVSIGGMAASGGYYLSCAGQYIFAEDTSIVGSIGVVGGKFAIRDPLASIGIHVVSVPASPDPKRAGRATYMSLFEPWDDATRAKVLRSMEAIYSTFLDRVAGGRKLDRSVVQSFAEGRIFGGKTGKEKGLVDQIGGLSEALDYALDQSGLGSDGDVVIVDDGGGIAALLGSSGGGSEEEAQPGVSAQAESRLRRSLGSLGPLAEIEKVLPAEALVWIESAAPMAEGESTLAALPFAIVLR